jgi:flagellar hook-basal body complex protein FliE
MGVEWLRCDSNAQQNGPEARKLFMNAKPKSTKEKLPDPPAEESTLTTFATQLQQSVGKLATLQKSALEIVSQQTAGMNTMLRDTLKSTPDAPSTLLLNVAEQAVQGWVKAQRNMLDLMTEQSEQAVAATKETSGSSTKSLAALNDLIRRTAGRAMAAEKDMVEFAASQNKTASEAIKRQAETAGTPVVAATEMMQHAVDALLENQREFLEVAAKLSQTIAAKA